MSPDLRKVMKEAAPEPSSDVDLETVQRRNRRLRWRDGIFTGVVTLILVGSGWLLFGGEDTTRRSDPAPLPSELSTNGPDASPKERAATFAIAAVMHSGLYDPDGIFFDYQSVEIEKERWLAHFVGRECKAYSAERGCYEFERLGRARVWVAAHGETLIVRSVYGSLRKWKPRLYSYTESVADGPPKQVFGPTLLTPSNSGLGLDAVYYWTGPIPERYEAECWFESLDAEGNVLYESRRWPTDSPRMEGLRDGGVLTGIPDDPNLDRVRGVCSEWTLHETYVAPPIPDDLELVDVGPEVDVPEKPTVVGHYRDRGDTGLPEGPQYAVVPEGPQYAVARGVFDEGEWGGREGKSWTFVAWGNKLAECHRFVVGDAFGGTVGTGCTSYDNRNDAQDAGPIGGWTFDPGGDDGLALTYGTLGKEVESVVFRLTSGEMVRTDAIDPPTRLDVPVKYYVAFIPPTENGSMIALDEDGRVLEKKRLCSAGGCI